ncbi:MAG: O-antigen ligase family protein [Actinobacteria bacterium]|nr:O-antigen ligase family protein [Actinomycetota bacterium]
MAVLVPLCLAVAERPQRGLLLLAALVPFHGLLLIVPAPAVATGWKEALVLLTLAATVVAPPEARGPSGRRLPPWTPAVVGLVVLGAVSAMIVGGLQAAVGMKTLFFYVLVAVAVWRCPLAAAERDRLVTVLMACGVVTAVVGLGQQVVGGAVLHGLGYEYNSAIRFAGSMLRSFSTFNQPFGFAFFLMLVILIGVPAALSDPGRRRNRAFLVALPVLGVALGFTFVRGAWIGVAVGLAYLGFTRHPVLLLGIPLGVTALLFLPQELAAPALSASSSVERVESWQERGSAVASAPLGAGVGATGSASEKVAELQSGKTRYQPDNYYFKVLLELGVLGLWLFVMLLVSIFATARLAASRLGGEEGAFASGVAATVMAAAVASLVATYLEIFPMDVYFWLFAGAVTPWAAASR